MIEDDDDFNFDESALLQIDRVAAATLSGKHIPTNKLTRQLTLTGEIIPSVPAASHGSLTISKSTPGAGSSHSREGLSRTKSTHAVPASRTKAWDYHQNYAKTGMKPKGMDATGKGGPGYGIDDEDEILDIPALPMPSESSR
jgi:hypothetical protein